MLAGILFRFGAELFTSIKLQPALVLAYLVRFIAVAYGPLENSLARIRPSLPNFAQ